MTTLSFVHYVMIGKNFFNIIIYIDRNEIRYVISAQITGRKRLKEISKIIVGYQQAFLSQIGNILIKNYKKIVKSSLINIFSIVFLCLYPKYLVINNQYHLDLVAFNFVFFNKFEKTV